MEREVPGFGRIYKVAKSNYWLHHACLSVLPHGTTRSPASQIFIKFGV